MDLWIDTSTDGSGITALDDRYVNADGDTMTGALWLPGDPTDSLQAATKAYVDAVAAGKASLAHNHDSSYSAISHAHSDYLSKSAGGTVAGSTQFTWSGGTEIQQRIYVHKPGNTHVYLQPINLGGIHSLEVRDPTSGNLGRIQCASPYDGNGVATVNWVRADTAAYAHSHAYIRQSGGSVTGTGIIYSGTSIVGNANSVGFRWGSPNIYGAVDNVVQATVGVVSLRRFKTDITETQNAMEKIGLLRPVEYTPVDIDGRKIAGKRYEGLIAEEVAKVVPTVTAYDGEGNVAGVEYVQIVPILIKAVQEMTARIDALETRLAALEGV